MNSPPCERGNARDVQRVGAHITDTGAQRVQHVAHVLDMRLGSGIPDNRLAAGRDGGHHDVLRRRYAGLVQQDVCSSQPLGSEFEHAIIANLGAQMLQGQDMRIKPAASNDIAPGRWQAQAAAPRRDGSRQQDGCTDAPAQIRIKFRWPHTPCQNAPRVGRKLLDFHAQAGDQQPHIQHIPYARHISQDHRLVSKQAGRKQRQRRVLVTCRCDLSV